MDGERVYWRVSVVRLSTGAWGYVIRRTITKRMDGEIWFRRAVVDWYGFTCARDAMIAACRSVFRSSHL